MSDMTGLANLVEQIKDASRNIEQGDAKFANRLDAIEKSVNDLYLKTQRPGGFSGDSDDVITERKSAIELCNTRHNLAISKNDGSAADYTPSSSEIDEAMLCRKALHNLFRHGDPARLEPMERKSLTSFSFGANAWILAPDMSNQVLSCILDPTDLVGMMNNVNISGASIRFLIDNVRMADAGWACETDCFANNPRPRRVGDKG